MISVPDIGAAYQHRVTRRLMTVVRVGQGNVLLMDRRGCEWIGSFEDFWATFRHAGIVRARRRRWEASRADHARTRHA